MSEATETKDLSADKRFQVPHELTIQVEEIDIYTAIECGFKMVHIEGHCEETGVKLRMDTGAGCGSPWIQVTVEKPDEEGRHYRINAAGILQAVGELAINTEAAKPAAQEAS